VSGYMHPPGTGRDLPRLRWWARPRTWMLAAAVAISVIAVARGVLAAEPFKAAMVACEPGKPCVVRHLFTSETACPVDMAIEVKLVPSGTRLECKPVTR